MRRLPPIEYPGNVPGVIYEPRALWDVTQVDPAEDTNGRMVLPRENFRNGEKWPVTLTHMIAAPINYGFRLVESLLPGPTTYHLGAAPVLNFTRVLVSAPQRQGYSRKVIAANAFTPRPRWEPRTNDVQQSAIWNVCRWDFDKPMLMPRQGTLEIQLSSVAVSNISPASPLVVGTSAFSVIVNEGPPPGTDAPGTVGVWPGNARIHQQSILRYGNPAQNWPELFPADGFGNAAGAKLPPAGATSNAWPPDSQLSAREYDSQNTTNAGSVPTTGFAVAIDQIDLDDTYIADTPPGVTLDLSPLAFRTACRARTRNGGTGHWWWRPGAPLALVTPTITPAQVYRLPTPITLSPGDVLEVELQAQRSVPFGELTANPLTNFGVSFTGYAAIEG